MKITSFNPLIVTGNAQAVIELFEALGFERRHNIKANTGNDPFFRDDDNKLAGGILAVAAIA